MDNSLLHVMMPHDLPLGARRQYNSFPMTTISSPLASRYRAPAFPPEKSRRPTFPTDVGALACDHPPHLDLGLPSMVPPGSAIHGPHTTPVSRGCFPRYFPVRVCDPGTGARSLFLYRLEGFARSSPRCHHLVRRVEGQVYQASAQSKAPQVDWSLFPSLPVFPGDPEIHYGCEGPNASM